MGEGTSTASSNLWLPDEALACPLMTEAKRLQTGDRAPAFYLADQSGHKQRLSHHKGRKVLLYFYPRADTPGCTTQACGLRDVATEVPEVVIVGVGPDDPQQLARFDNKYGLGFTLLSDPDHAIAEKYGVWGIKKMYGKTRMGIIRSAFLIDERGRIAQAWYKISPKDTPLKLQQAMEA